MSSHQTKTPVTHNYALITLFVLLILAGIAIDGPATLSTLKKAHSQQATTKISPTSFPAPTDAMMPGWKTYANRQDGYSIDAPSVWFAESYPYINPSQTYNGNFSFYPSGPDASPYTPQASYMSISYPIAFTDYFKGTEAQAGEGLTALKALVNSKYDNDWRNVTHYSTFTTISGHPALINETVSARASEVTPPPGFAGDGPCDQCYGKSVYIDLRNGKFLEIDAAWGKARSDFEATFDKAVSTLRYPL